MVANFTKFQVLGLIVQLVQCTTRKSYLSDLSKEDNFNPLTLKSDLLLISSYSIAPESNIKVMRILEMINKYRSSWLLSKISLSAP